MLTASGALCLVLLAASVRSLPTRFQYPLTLDAPHPQTRNAGRFLHITDVHIDTNYVPDSSTSAACHRYSTSIPKGVYEWAGPYGTPLSSCDAPLELFDGALEFVKNNLTKGGFDFVLWTGDTARHDNDPLIKKMWIEIVNANMLGLQRIREVVGDEVPLIATIGNNDIEVHDQLPYYGDGSDNKVLVSFSRIWAESIIPIDQLPGFQQHGSYYRDVRVSPTLTLRIASLNTLYLYISNRASNGARTCDSSSSGGGGAVLTWLEKEVLAPVKCRNKQNKEDRMKVLIMGHVAPSAINYWEGCLDWMNKLMEAYGDVIASQHYGHMNIDHFLFPEAVDESRYDFEATCAAMETSSALPVASFINSNKNRPSVASIASFKSRLPAYLLQAPSHELYTKASWLSMYASFLFERLRTAANAYNSSENLVPSHLILISPSLIPSYQPTLRVVDYNTSDGLVVDWTQYWADLKPTLEDPSLDLEFKVEYVASEAYRFTKRSESGTRPWVELAAKIVGMSPSNGKNETEELKGLFFKHMVVSSGVQFDIPS
ncbi:Endopolyphosphatase [Chytridiales sp. JEL 0842]|nr:Endopolyphosphatase [Chytridiales sp. JEL 0842]